MANIIEPTPENLEEHSKWLEELPPNEREIMEKYPPWKLYRMKSTGQRVTILSVGTFDDGIKFRVNISGKYNAILFERQVFGVDYEDLEECDLPTEPVGALFKEQEEINEMIKLIREEMGNSDT